ncbi:MAG: hypothetical protein WEB33_02900 [Bacteroidota bacterium]
MSTIFIQLPPVQSDNYVDVDLTVNGKKQQFKYRVEIFKWSDWCAPAETKADGIRKMINNYDRNWQLVEIGAPTDATVPLMFRKKG